MRRGDLVTIAVGVDDMAAVSEALYRFFGLRDSGS